MSKLKGFNNPLEGNALFTDQPQEKPDETPVKKKMGRPRREDIQRGSGAGEGLREDSVRYTVIFPRLCVYKAYHDKRGINNHD